MKFVFWNVWEKGNGQPQTETVRVEGNDLFWFKTTFLTFKARYYVSQSS